MAERGKAGMERFTLKAQIVIAYSLMAAMVCGISIVLSLISLTSLSENVDSSSRRIIVRQSLTNAHDLAREIADTAAQRLDTLGNSMSKVSARYSKILLTTTDSTRPARVPPFKLLTHFPSYAEFNFTAGCSRQGRCPVDYNPLPTRRDGSYDHAAQNGSLLHASTYLYSSALARSIRTTAAWDSVFGSSQALTDVHDALAVQDEDQRVMFSNIGSYISYLYLAAKVKDRHSDEYFSLLRKYPGEMRNSSEYDPAARPWFTGARADAIHAVGPYVEAFARQSVVVLSTKQSFPYLDREVDVVSAAGVDVESFRELVTSISYINGGFAVIFNKLTLEVVAWANRTDLVNATTGLFEQMHSLDPLLPVDLCAKPTFEYADSAGTVWLGGCANFFNASASTARGAHSNGQVFTVVVFAQKSIALQSLNALRHEMRNSVSGATALALAIVLCSSFVVMVLVFTAVWNITNPLDTMRRMALQVIDVMAEDEEARDFAPILNRARFNMTRTDEVGVLACDFHSVICMVHNKVVEKHSTPRYPLNPWALECEDDSTRLSTLTWQDLRVVDASRSCEALAVSTGQKSVQVKTFELALPSPTASNKASSKSSRRMRGRAHRVSGKASVRKRFEGKVVPLVNDQVVTIAQSLPVGWLTCLKTQLSSLAALLLIGGVGAMVATVLIVQHHGGTWSDEAARAVTATQVANLQSIAAMKSLFVEAFFAQMTLDMRTTAAAFTSLLMGEVTAPTWEADESYLYSYSLDVGNPYSFDPRGAVFPFSSYYRFTDANCSDASPPSCSVTRNSTQSRLTSLLDMKMESLFYPSTYLSFIQTAHEDTGYVRFWPMWYLPSFSVPTLCWAVVSDTAFCVEMRNRSKCGNASVPTYPAYDPRCRDWYALSRTNPSTESPSYTHPRLVVDGSFVITSVLNIANRTSGVQLGVINLNFFVESLRTSITSRPIMTSGYTYIVDARDVDTVVVHPQQTVSCGTLRCTEGLGGVGDEDYLALKRDVLQAHGNATDTYRKDEAVWRVATHPVRHGTVDYLLVATVPDAEVIQFATDAQSIIDRSTHDMILGFTVAIAVAVTCMTFLIANMVRLIMKPLDDLRQVMKFALRRDFSRELPKYAGSVDMAALICAITQMLVALRLGSDASDRLDVRRMHVVFADSVNLFAASGNRKGLGASLSNLAALELALGNITTAEKHYRHSIEIANALISTLEATIGRGGRGKGGDEDIESTKADLRGDLLRARRVRSDREGNLAVALLERGELGAARALLERLLVEDRQNLHIRGCVWKQSLLGHYYLRKKQLADAERVFSASLALVRALQGSAGVRGSAMSEADACEMLALCDLAALAEARSWRTSVESLQMLEHRYLQALVVPAHMDRGSARRILCSLSALYARHPQFTEAKRLVQGIAEAHGLSLLVDAEEGMALAKRVVLVLDYSGSMAGARLRAIKDALHAFIKEHVRARDSLGIICFSDSVEEVLPLAVKAESLPQILKCVESLTSPSGGVACYDAVLQALSVLRNGTTPGDWVVVLAGGADGTSRSGLDTVLRGIVESRASVVALGVGAEAPEGALQGIAQAAAQGFCLCSPATKQDIQDLFDEVARLLHSSAVTLEDY